MHKDDSYIFCCYLCDELFMDGKKERCKINMRFINLLDETCPPSWCPKGYASQQTAGNRN